MAHYGQSHGGRTVPACASAITAALALRKIRGIGQAADAR